MALHGQELARTVEAVDAGAGGRGQQLDVVGDGGDDVAVHEVQGQPGAAEQRLAARRQGQRRRAQLPAVGAGDDAGAEGARDNLVAEADADEADTAGERAAHEGEQGDDPGVVAEGAVARPRHQDAVDGGERRVGLDGDDVPALQLQRRRRRRARFQRGGGGREQRAPHAGVAAQVDARAVEGLVALEHGDAEGRGRGHGGGAGRAGWQSWQSWRSWWSWWAG